MSIPSVSINIGAESDGAPRFIIKLQGDDCELNVWVSLDELTTLRGVESATWSDRGSLRIGECLGAPAFWSCQDGRLSVLVGPDDETWDAGVFLDESVLPQLVAEIDRVKTMM